MFAAASSAKAAVQELLDAGAALALRDKRRRCVLDYASKGSEVRELLETRWVHVQIVLSREW